VRLKKWEVVRVWRPDLDRPHDKFCICLCWEKRWFFYINSNPPKFRKAREVAVQVENYEALFLHHTSYIDVSSIISDLPEQELLAALADEKRCHGALSPSLIGTIIPNVQLSASLTESEKFIILN
jgi:hypothetical protein